MNATTNTNRKLKRVGESDYDYAKRAARAARGKFNRLREESKGYYHSSFDVRAALEWVESVYTDLGTFGVEYVRLKRYGYIDYLNTGDSYGTTVMFVKGRFIVGNWGDLAERE